MKKLHILPTLTIAAALLAPAVNGADDKNKNSDWSSKDKQSQSGQQMGDLRRVSQDSIDREFTASDLIGKSVYDQEGEKIGDISDISLQSKVAEKFREAAEGRSDSGLLSGNNDTERRANEGMDRASSAMDSLRGGDETVVFISVGGLFGIGSDIVSAPVSALSYNQEEDQFTMSHSKDQVVALADQETEEYSSASYRDTNASDRSSSDRTMSGSQQWSDEVTGIREALRNDDELSGQAAGIIVTSEGDKLHLRGTVSSEDHKDRAEELAMEHTDMDVENSITVRD